MRSPILVVVAKTAANKQMGMQVRQARANEPRAPAAFGGKHRRDPEDAHEKEVGERERRRHPSAPDCEGEEDDDGKENRAQNVILHDSPGRYEHDEHATFVLTSMSSASVFRVLLRKTREPFFCRYN